MDWGAVLPSLLFDFIVTVFGYLLVPVIFCLLRKPLTAAQIKKIVIINGIVVWLIFRILILELTGEMSTGFSVFLWSGVAHWMLKKCCLKKDVDAKKNYSDGPRVSLSYKNETPKRYGNYAVPASNLRLNTKASYSELSKGTPVLDSKQHSSNNGVALVCVIILLILSVIFNVKLAIENRDCKESMSFYDENAACISSNDSYRYHKYGCDRFDDSSDFWILTTDYAEYMGYNPCIYCCD